jgi:hypothetical protein
LIRTTARSQVADEEIAERIKWGDWGEAVMLELGYKHPRTGKRTRFSQAVRIARRQPFELKVSARASVMCWGVMPSGTLRHPLFLSWCLTTTAMC